MWVCVYVGVYVLVLWLMIRRFLLLWGSESHPGRSLLVYQERKEGRVKNNPVKCCSITLEGKNWVCIWVYFWVINMGWTANQLKWTHTHTHKKVCYADISTPSQQFSLLHQIVLYSDGFWFTDFLGSICSYNNFVSLRFSCVFRLVKCTFWSFTWCSNFIPSSKTFMREWTFLWRCLD